MKHIVLVATLVLLSNPSGAEARSFRLLQLPNGGDNCNVCHVNANGGARNPFGLDVEAAGLSGVGGIEAQDVVWLNACANDLDSDGDGYPNGVELGDPQCTWVTGDADPVFTVSNPGNMMSTPCGNGTIEAPFEDCDGISLGGQTCISVGLPAGVLRCNNDCTLNTDGCVGSTNTNNATNNATNNMTSGTNNMTTGTNNTVGTNNAVNNSTGNNGTGNTDPTDPAAPSDKKIEPFFCDGEMSSDEDYKNGATAVIGLFLAALFRRRLFQ